MSATTFTSRKTRLENAFVPIVIPFPAFVFAPWEVTISSAEASSNLPKSFRLVPQIQNGNIHLTVENVRYSPTASPNPPLWRVLNTTTNAMKTLSDSNVSIVLQSSLEESLVLTGQPGIIPGDGETLSGHWHGLRHGEHLTGTWNANLKDGENISFLSRFTWTFLLTQDPPAQNKAEQSLEVKKLPEEQQFPETVIFDFEISLQEGATNGQLIQHGPSFPRDWELNGDKCFTEGIFLQLKSPEGETYLLQNGFFSGAFSALVCQGNWIPEDNAFAATAQETGSWTGTSGGPM